MTMRGRGRGAWGAGLLLVVALGVTGCGTAGPPPPDRPAPTGSGVPSVPAEGPSGTPAPPEDTPDPDEVLVHVNVSGGFAGVSNELTVRYDGRYTTRSGTKPERTGRMSPAGVGTLREALEDPAYAKVPARPTGTPVFDGFQYVIAHQHRVVVTGDGERPPALDRVLAALPDDARLTST